MTLTTDFKTFSTIIDKTSFDNDGDKNEKLFGNQIIDTFPNCEVFWKRFVVPMTKRIDLNTHQDDRIRKRNEVSEDIYEIAVFHYSAFLKLAHAYENLENIKNNKIQPSFEQAYAHLASCCDLAEDLFLKIQLLTNECNSKQIEVLTKLKLKDFLDLSRKWYNENYHNIYDHYLSKGKFMSISVPKRDNLLNEYFNSSEDWKSYSKFTALIRQYRNVLIHSAVIGKLTQKDTGKILVPKKEVISNYKKLMAVLNLKDDKSRHQYDFIDMYEQLESDITKMKEKLNVLWKKPIEDLTQLLYVEKNRRLLEKYGINFN